MDVEQRHLVVGFESHNYGGERNAYAPVPGVEHRKVRRVPFSVVPALKRRQFDRAFVPLGPTGCDLVHLWNRTSFARAPWGASFSSLYPYYHPEEHRRWLQTAVPRVVSDRCRFLAPISDYALRSLRSNVGEQAWAEIEHKVRVVPPNHVIPPSPSPRALLGASDPVRLLFVGVTFFGKGGEAVLNAFEGLCDQLNLHLTVVSPVRGNDYEATPPDSTDVAQIRQRLQNNSRIKWIERLTRDEVLLAMQQHDLGLLPTLADTYGYVVLEFMGLGVPTVVTNVQALPSFTGPDTGWTLDLPTDERGLWVGRHRGAKHRATSYREAMGILEERLSEVFVQIREHPELLGQRGNSARLRLEQQFDPKKRGDLMRSVYDAALDGWS